MEASNKPVQGSLMKPSGLGKKSLRGTIVAPKFTPSVRLKPHIGLILSDAYTVIAEEFRALRTRVEEGRALSPEETRKFVQMADTVAKLAREEREQEKRSDPGELSDEALLEMLEQAKEALGSGD